MMAPWLRRQLRICLTSSAIVTYVASQIAGIYPVTLADGGTGANLAASNGGIFYSNASTGAILSGTATANQMLQSGSSAAPGWSTATWPATTTANDILYSSSANIVGQIATGNNGVLITSAGGSAIYKFNACQLQSKQISQSLAQLQ